MAAKKSDKDMGTLMFQVVFIFIHIWTYFKIVMQIILDHICEKKYCQNVPEIFEALFNTNILYFERWKD